MRTSSTAAAVALSLGLVTGSLVGYGGAAGPDMGRPAEAVAAVKQKTKVPGHQIRIVLAGNRLGQRAKIRLVGVKGRADGETEVVKVETTKRVKHLPPGRYRVVPRAITTAAGRASAETVRVTVTARRGATARITYRFTKATLTPVTPTPTRLQMDTTAPGPVTGLTVASRTPTSITLSWTNPPDADLTEVIVRRAKGTTAPGSASEGTGVGLGAPTATSVTDTGLDPNTVLSYAVFTRDAAGNTSGPTTVAANTPPWPVRPESITAGYIHTCGLDVAGKAWCWGDGSSGQLGDVFESSHQWGTPYAVAGGHTFTSLTARGYHTCGLDNAGKAWCWGHGLGGVLGDGNTSDHTVRTPVAVVGGHTFSQLTTGDHHTCGLDGTGKAWCWGNGDNGQLGDGDTSDHTTGTPVAVGGGVPTFSQLTAGGWHTCGIGGLNTAWCWGQGQYGRLGDGDTSDHDTGTPVAVVGSHKFNQLTAGARHTCGVESWTSDAWCWGQGQYGKLGDGDTSDHDTGTPVAVVGGHIFWSLTAGRGHTCGLQRWPSGAVCWGQGQYGQLGDDDADDHDTGTPVAVVGGHTFSRLTAGDWHTCALDSTGKAWCWGYGQYGTLGDDDISDHDTGTPVAVVGGHTFALP